jgi:ABC-type phosphate transport system substrate-binding protein
MRHILNHLLLLVTLVGAGGMGCPAWGAAFASEMVVVVAVNAPVEALTREQVADLFLGRAKTFPNGSVAIPIDVQDDPLYADFHLRLCERTPKQLQAHWAKMVFAGRANPPRNVPLESVRNLVAKNPNLIGYLPREALDSSVKTVLVVR